MNTTIRILAILSLAMVACGDGDPGDGTIPADTAAPQPPEEAGLPIDSVDFQTTEWADAEGLSGTLWVSGSEPDQETGISLTAQLEGVPTGQAYSWAVHRGECTEQDSPVLPLGYGTEAVDEGAERTREGGPLGATRAAFEPTVRGEVSETVWIPLDGELGRTQLEQTPHTLRIHPDAGGGDLQPSVACAPIPGVPADSA